MKRVGGLYPLICERENLRLAAWKALRSKRGMSDARAFMARMDEALDILRWELLHGAVRLTPPRQFVIHDPKRRTITAPCFRERVLHHAIMNVVEPELERYAIHHSYACRAGKGQFAALTAARKFAWGHEWFLKLDVRKYFDSIPKALLLERLERRFKDRELLSLLRQLVSAFQPEAPCGLPIGSLLSQHLANFYLGWLDHFITVEMRCGSYLRYMDDFVLWHQDGRVLAEMLPQVNDAALGTLHLTLKPAQRNRTMRGMTFLGHRVWPGRLTLSRVSKQRYARKLKAVCVALGHGEINEGEAQERALSLVAFTRHSSCLSFRRRVAQGLAAQPKAPTA
ncbi:MAG: reverse transcriptase/maturase family protein [Roseimicrobium sp.]